MQIYHYRKLFISVFLACIVIFSAIVSGCRNHPTGYTETSSHYVTSSTSAAESNISTTSEEVESMDSENFSDNSEYSNNTQNSQASISQTSSDSKISISSGSSTSTGEPNTSNAKKLIEEYLKPILSTKETFVKQGFSNFIRLSKNKLYDGDNVYRFMSVNTPSIQYNVDAGLDDKWMRITPYEIEDAIKTVAQMGGQVVRIHTLSFRRENQSIIRNVYGPDQYDELMMRDLDLVIAYANKYKVRVFIPFINPWYFIGANYDFDRWCGGDGTAYSFYHNENTRKEFKELLSYILNRTNYYTGVKYKDDKAIFAWELGNELNQPYINKPKSEGGEGQIDGLVTDEWVEDISAYIKSIDPNHLIANGGQYDPTPGVLACENIDIITMHYTTPLGFGKESLSPVRITLNDFIESGKAYVHGEFDPVNGLSSSFLDQCYDNPLISGAMAWSLRQHAKTGGFLCHNDWNKPPLRWPGFSNGMDNEVWKLWSMRESSYLMQGVPVPDIDRPDAPILLPITSPKMISFRGSAGADNYILERAESPNGPWKVISSNVTDNQYRFFVPYSDTSADISGDYFYRLYAKNRSGKSEPSNIVPFSGKDNIWVDMEEETFGSQFVDEFNSLDKVDSIVNNANILYTNSNYRDQYNFAALGFSGNASITYKFDSDIKDYFITIGWKNNAYQAISVKLSKDGKTFTESSYTLCDYGDAYGQHFGRLEKFPVPSGFRYLRISSASRFGLENDFEINRLEVNLK